MSKAEYKNHKHYISDGWSSEPKESFKCLVDHINENIDGSLNTLLDVGCAAGELIGYLKEIFPHTKFTGVDVFEELITECSKHLPSEYFVQGSALELPDQFNKEFDVVTAMGCMSIFNETEIEDFWDSLLKACKPNGTIIVLAPMNEYGVDTMIRHRKRINDQTRGWETGWNIFSYETIKEILDTRNVKCTFFDFKPDITLSPKDDPVRTWTFQTENNKKQLTNGMKLLVDHKFIVVHNSPQS